MSPLKSRIALFIAAFGIAARSDAQAPTPTTVLGGVPVVLPVARRAAEDGDWRRWWEQNADRFLAPRIARRLGLANRFDPAIAPFDDAALRRLRREVEPRLIVALRDPSPAVCAAALLALGRIGGPERDDLAERLREHLTGEAPRRDIPEIREAAALALGYLGRPESVRDLLEIYGDDPHERTGGKGAPARLRIYAALAVGMIGARSPSAVDRSVVERLLRDAGSPAVVAEVRAAAVAAVGLARIPDAAERLHEIIRSAGTEESVRAEAAYALGRLGDPAAVPLLERLAREHGSARVRRAAASGLGLLVDADHERALRVLVDVAEEDADRLVRQAAIMALAEAGGDPARETLLRRARLGAGPDRLDAVLALGLSARLRHLERSATGDFLAALAGSARAENERAVFLLALGLADHAASRDLLLREALAGGGGDVRGYAALAWGLLTEAATPEDLDRLRGALRSETSPEVVRRSAVALVQRGDPHAEAALIGVAESFARNGPAFTGAACGLGLAGDFAAAQVLGKTAVGEAGDDVRAAAVAALGLLADKDDASPARALRRFARRGDDPLRASLAALD
jgi:HEAT repeat protein